jgi:isocaprenoyl-coA:2-hydroxyisocaproate coA-transferase
MEKGTSPCNTAAAMGDHYAGMSLAAGILAALHRREKLGIGEKVSVALFHTAVFGMGLPVVSAQYGYSMPITRRMPPNPINTTFKTQDEQWIQIAFFQYEKWFPNFCNIVIERPDLIDGPYSTLKGGIKGINEFVPMLEEIFIQKPAKEWIKRLSEAGIPFEKLQTPGEILEDEQCWANDYLFKHTYENGHEGILYNTPVLFEEYGIKEFVRAPKLGEHTEETLKEIGYSDEQIKELKDKKII